MLSEIDQQKLREQVHALEEKLASLSAPQDQAAFRRVQMEYQERKKILDLIDDEEKITKQRDGVKSMAQHESDPAIRAMAEQEFTDLEKKLETTKRELDELLHPADPLDKKNIIVEIRAAAGGDEAALFAAQLFRMYTRYAEDRRWKTRLISQNRTGIGGYKEIIFSIEGERVYSRLRYESGVHRVQRVPETEKSGRVHTSTATVAVLPEADEVDIVIDPKDLEMKASTAGGHGGQSVNTTYSAIRIVHLPTGIVVQCQDERNFQQNKLKAMEVLRARLLDMETRKRTAAEASSRKSQVGTGERSEKIRTYNFPQDRVTDHRLSDNFHDVPHILDGNLDPIIEELKTAERSHAN
ncbi:MAG: peptide chain release factor 1 [Patescibacteria group bacterium]